MTDHEADALRRPHLRWPPLSAAAAAGLLLMPPVTMIVALLYAQRWPDLLVPLVCLAVVVRPATNLLRGNPSGVGGGFGVLILVLVFMLPVAVLRLINRLADWWLLLEALPVASWLTLTGFLLWWPATRRWCGLLPPAGTGND